MPERACLAAILVLGDDRSRKGEAIVQAGADDVAVEARAGGGSADGDGNATNGVHQRAHVKGHAAEVIIEIFDLEAPVGIK